MAMVPANNIVSDFNSAFNDFLEAAVEDPRLGPLHVSLYVAILHFYNAGNGLVPISVFGRQLMKREKISSHDTYHRYIRELHQYGYVHYIPSCNPWLGSLIYPLKLDRK